MKIILFTVVGIVVLFGLLIGIGIYMYQKEINEENPEYIVRFIKENVGKGKVSLSINCNGQKWVEVNPNIPLPLASTVKTIVAIEYAQQAALGKIDPQQEVSLEELNTFYIPKTDGGAHEAWISNLNREKAINKVPISEIANGMISYSSNANTDYLINLLGLQNINNVPESLGIFSHEPLYPMGSALFIPSQLMNDRNLTKKELIKAMKSMEMSEYRNSAIDIHNKWLSYPLSEQGKKQVLKVLDMEIQKNLSDRLPRSTTEDYIMIMEKLNTKKYFNEDIHKYLDPVMEQLMENPNNREWLVHAGQKGGSTAFIITKAMYATDKDGNRAELAFFANDLTSIEQVKLSKNMNAFQLKFLKDEEFRKHIKKELS